MSTHLIQTKTTTASKTLAAVERERERERESNTLNNTIYTLSKRFVPSAQGAFLFYTKH